MSPGYAAPPGPLTEAELAVLGFVDPGLLVAATRRLVRVPGQNPPGQEAATAAELCRLAQEAGLAHRSWDVQPGRPNVEVTLPGGDGPGLLLLGHTDVVPVGAGWSVDPFGGELREGRIWGRGATDMLGGLAACLTAMRALRLAGVELSGSVLLAALADEEQQGIGIREWIARPERPDLIGCMVAEPTDLQTIIAARGASYLRIVVRGVAAHAGRPDDGRNAIGGAALVVAELERWHHDLAARTHPLVGPPTVNVGVIHGGVGGSVVPAECTLEVDRRLLPGERIAPVVADLRDRLVGLGLDTRGLSTEVEALMDMPGYETPAEHGFVTSADAAVQLAGGPGLPLGGWTAACDGGFVAQHWGLPVVTLGPGSVSEQAHRPDESVGVDALVTAARTYALTALRLLA